MPEKKNNKAIMPTTVKVVAAPAWLIMFIPV
jgi:hypothetical protein